MHLPPGTRLGPYEVVAPLGAGAMGEVYRARDTRLDRSVAVKVLPAAFASDPASRDRLEREARTISALNHPHICALYDVGDNYIVMELLEGETLAERLEKGPLALPQALRIGIDVADALDKAHRCGIVHRDLKPGNIMLTKSGAKLLDFGLAKSTEPIFVEADGRTLASALTEKGTIVGTLQYMSPEQLEGRPADARSDLFAFGAVLYEMMTGRRAFAGESRASVIAAIMNSDPPSVSELRPMTPAALDRLVRTCLAKEADERWQTAHDVMLQLRGILDGGSGAGAALNPAEGASHKRLPRERVAWSVAALALVAAIAALILPMRPTAPPAELVHFTVETPLNTSLYPFDTKGLAISPDGSMIAFVAEDLHGIPSLYVRNLASAKVAALAGTDDASYPFWSPDSTQIGFFANHELRRIDVKGGTIVTLCEAPSGRGGTWNRDGVILFAPTLAGALYRISAGGGRAEPVTPPDQNGGTRRQRWPRFLPDDKRFLYVDGSNLMVGSLDGHLQKLVLADVSNAAFVQPDRLVFSRGDVLMSQRFDPDALAVRGDAVPLPFGSVSYMNTKALSILSASENGTLAFLPAPDRSSRLVWVDMRGREDGEIGEAGGYEDAALSPDGKRIAVVRNAPDGSDIWMLDTADGRLSRFTFHPGQYGFPCWSRDSKQLAYFMQVDTIGQVCLKSLDGVERCPVLSTRTWQIPYDFSPDGMTILIWTQTPTAGGDIYTLSLGPKPALTPFVTTPFEESSPTFSPDGKWVAFQSNASMRNEVYVRRYPPTNEQWQISTAGGESPMWSADGRELFYGSGDTIMHAPIGSGASLSPGTPTPLFRIPGRHVAPRVSGSVSRPIISGVTPDRQRFLFRLGTDQPMPPIHVVLNWKRALRDTR